MAAPLVALLPAILSALWAGLVVCFKWLIDHAHVIKIVGVCILITAAFKLGRFAYSALVDTVDSYLGDIAANAPQGRAAAFSVLAKANYCLPVSETFALLLVYVTFASLCLGLKFVIAGYKAIPFKSA